MFMLQELMASVWLMEQWIAQVWHLFKRAW